jgi:hypothetical protein
MSNFKRYYKAINFYFFIIIASTFIFSCNSIDDKTKKELKKESKKVAKQISGTLNNKYAQGDFIFFEADKNKTSIKTFWKDKNGNILGSLGVLCKNM